MRLWVRWSLGVNLECLFEKVQMSMEEINGKPFDSKVVGFHLFGLVFAFFTAKIESSASVPKNSMSLQGNLNKMAGHLSQSNS